MKGVLHACIYPYRNARGEEKNRKTLVRSVYHEKEIYIIGCIQKACSTKKGERIEEGSMYSA